MARSVSAARRLPGGRRLSPIFLRDPSQPSFGLASSSCNDAKRASSRKLIAFGWYGGKHNHLEWLLPLLPQCHHYCEPFAGSAAVLINREPSPVETVNDLDGALAKFFRVLRDAPDEFVQQVALTPFSREEFYRALYEPGDELADVERARRFFVRARQARTGLAQTATLGRWANCKNTSRSGMSGVVSRWLNSVHRLPDIADRLLRVQIENRPALDAIRLYDDHNTLFYCDPPYLHSTRGDAKAYGFEMSEMDHRQLARQLHKCKAKVAISGYRCKVMDELYSDWKRHDAPAKNCHSIKKIRREALWVNF